MFTYFRSANNTAIKMWLHGGHENSLLSTLLSLIPISIMTNEVSLMFSSSHIPVIT